MKADRKTHVISHGTKGTHDANGTTGAHEAHEADDVGHAPPVDAELPDIGATAKITGAQTHVAHKAGAGTAAVLHGLNVIDDALAKESGPSKRFMAGLAGAVLGLMLLASWSDPAHADPLKMPEPPAAHQIVLPPSTGPPLLDLSVPKTTAIGIQLDAATKKTVIDSVTRQALDNFTLRLEQALRVDARGLALNAAEGRVPLAMGGSLSPDQEREVMRAARTLLRELPVGALAPDLVTHVESFLDKRGVPHGDIATTRVKDLGDVGEALLDKMLSTFRGERPAVFYGLAVGAAGALGAVTYLEGTDTLKSLGIAPEIKTGLFNDALQARLGLQWGKKLTNPEVQLGLQTSQPFTLGTTPLTGTFGVHGVMAGKDFGHLEARGFAVTSSVTGRTVGGIDLAASATYFTQDGRVLTSVSAGYQPTRDLGVFAFGSHDSKGTTAVGLGVQIRF
jgi:hypothetical protein